MEFKRSLGLFDALAIGIGAIIGAGIFVVTGISAGLAGPALLLSLLIGACISGFTALSFAELASLIPKEGGGYEFAHELIAICRVHLRVAVACFQYRGGCGGEPWVCKLPCIILTPSQILPLSELL